MLLLTDQTGQKLQLNYPARRIVSLVPSQTELLFDLGLEDEVVGITKFCVHPASWFRQKPRVGGTKQLHYDRIQDMQPDLIIANKEENVKEQVEALREKWPVYTSDISNLSDTYRMFTDIGRLTARDAEAEKLIENIQRRFLSLPILPSRLRVAYLIWNEPLMTVGSDTFIHHMMTMAGLENVFVSRRRYPVVTAEELINAKPDFILLSSEPYPFSQKHADKFSALLSSARVELVDGEMFSWYGSRLKLVPDYFQFLQKRLTDKSNSK